MPAMTTSDEQKKQWRVKDAAGVVHEAPSPFKNPHPLYGTWQCGQWGGSSPRNAVADWATHKPINWTEIAEPGQLFASEQADAARADERQRFAQSMRDAAAFAIAEADKIKGVITRDEFVRKAAHTSQHFSLLAWEKSILRGSWSDEPVRLADPAEWPEEAHAALDDASIIGEE